VTLALAATVLFLASGAAVLAGIAWAGPAAVTATAVSLLLPALVFNWWLSLSVLINAAIITAVLGTW
jgi:hypothetical protein